MSITTVLIFIIEYLTHSFGTWVVIVFILLDRSFFLHLGQSIALRFYFFIFKIYKEYSKCKLLALPLRVLIQAKSLPISLSIISKGSQDENT